MILKVFYGTSWTYPNEFNRLSLKYSQYKGIFFISHLATAQFYALNKESLGTPIILEGNLTLDNPYHLTDTDYDNLMDLYADGKGNRYYNKMKKSGYDGLIFPENEMGIEVVCFNSSSFVTTKTGAYRNYFWNKI